MRLSRWRLELDRLSMSVFFLKLIGILGVLTAAGCSSNSVVYPEVAAVVGVVTLNGQPLQAVD